MPFADEVTEEEETVVEDERGEAGAAGAAGDEDDVIVRVSRRKRPAEKDKKGGKLKWALLGFGLLLFFLVAMLVFISYARAAGKRERQKESAPEATAAQGQAGQDEAGAGEMPGDEIDVGVVEQVRREYGDAAGAGAREGVPDLQSVPGDGVRGQDTAGEVAGGGVMADPAFARPGASPTPGEASAAAEGERRSRFGSAGYSWPSVPSNVSVRYAPVEGSAVAPPAAAAGAQPQVSRGGVNLSSGGRTEAPARTIPPVGSRIKVVSAGAFFAPSSDESMVMLTTLSDERGGGWYLPAGTLFVGKVKGVVARKRIEVSVFGFVDGDKLVTLKGNVLGEDMGVGMPGEVYNKEGLAAKFGRGVMNALPVAAALLGPYRYVTSVIPGSDDVYGRARQDQSYVAVEGGVVGHVSIMTLPEQVQGRYPEAGGGGQELTPAELELIKQIRAAREVR